MYYLITEKYYLKNENTDDRKGARTDNRRLAKKWFKRLIEHSTTYQLLFWFESLALRNPLLRQAPKRYKKLKINCMQKENLLYICGDQILRPNKPTFL